MEMLIPIETAFYETDLTLIIVYFYIVIYYGFSLYKEIYVIFMLNHRTTYYVGDVNISG